MGHKFEPRSKIYDFDSIEADDELDVELSRLYAKHRELTKNKSEIELHNYLQDKASQNKKEYNDVISALLYGVLTEPEKARMHFQSISFVNRDHFANIVKKLQVITLSIKFPLLRPLAREQIFWLISELTNLNVPNVDILYLCLMRQIRGGDLSQPNVLLCDQILRLLELHKSFLDTNPKIVATVVYTYLRVIADHRSSQLQTLQQKEIRFIIPLIRDKWKMCVPIGRDLIRVLHDLSSIPEFAQLWDDLLNNPQKISPSFKGVDTILKTPTPKEFLKCRLTPDIEFKLLYIVQNLRINYYQQNLNWFVQRFLSTPESEPFYVDIIRYLVAGWYPNNQILQSDIVPRYVIIGSMLRSIKNSIVAANVKTAIIFDWLFFTPNDNIMFIEPAMLLIERSAERYPTITAVMLEFLKMSVDKYFPPLKEYMARCVACGMGVLLSKGVIRSLTPIYKCSATEPITREYMQVLFSEYLSEEHTGSNNHPPPALPSSVSMHATNSSTPEISHATIKTEPSTSKSETTETADTEDIDSTKKERQARRLSIPQRLSSFTGIKDEDDVDAFLYGDSENNVKPQDEDEDMEPASVSEGDTHTREQSVPQLDDDIPEMTEEPMNIEDDFEAESEDENANSLQSHQSYWIFGDSLKRYKESCSLVATAQKQGNVEEYNAQILTAKKSLKEILAVFMRMAIPAETLAATIGSHIRNIIVSNLLTLNLESDTHKSEDIITDPSKDVFDMLMFTFWEDCKNDASKEKMIQLLGSIAQFKKNKGKRHIIGMRWWLFMTMQLEEEDGSLNTDSWFPNVLKNYEAFVKYSYNIEKPTKDETAYLREYLRDDLQMLAEYSIPGFNAIIPMFYQYLPEIMVGDSDMLKLTILMLLPDTIGSLTLSLHYGGLRVFGENLDVKTISESLLLETHETACLWQLLAAELHGKKKDVELFFKNTQIIELFKTSFKNEIVPPLFSVITSIQPTKDLLHSIFQMIPTKPKSIQPQFQFVLATLQYWSNSSTEALSSSLSELTSWMIDQAENEDSQPELFTVFLNILNTWWSQKLVSESFKEDKKLLASLFKLGNLIGFTCPKEWAPEIPRKKKRALVFDSDED